MFYFCAHSFVKHSKEIMIFVFRTHSHTQRFFKGEIALIMMSDNDDGVDFFLQ